MKKIVLLTVLLIIGVLFAGQIKRGFLSLLILIDIVRPVERPVMGKFIDAPAKTTVTVSGNGRLIQADLYRPRSAGRHFPLLLVHSVNAAGKDDERIRRLAMALGRAGFLVLVPDLEGLKTLHIRTPDAEDLLKCFLHLCGIERDGSGGGMLGIGYGAGPMLLAAADSRIRDQVRVVATIGGYYDLRSVMLFSLTGAYEYGNDRGYVRPDGSLRWMFVYRNLDLLRTLDDRAVLKQVIDKKNQYEPAAADAIAKSLGPEGRALYAFLSNSDQDRFAPLYENLPLQVRELTYQLSPWRAMRYIKASFIIVHGVDDDSIPYTESLRLADAVGDQNRVHRALLPYFVRREPVEPSAGEWFQRRFIGGWRLFSAIYVLLEKGAQHEYPAH